jgi:hypothetical protein
VPSRKPYAAAGSLMARSRDQLEQVSEAIQQAGGRAIAVTGDATNAADVGDDAAA